MSNLLRFPGKSQKKVGRKSSLRLPVLYLVVLLIFGAVTVRLVQIQVVQAEQLGQVAVDQRSRRLEVAPDRGKILDRNGEILAISIEMDTIYATPYLIEDTATTARLIAKALKEDFDTVYEKLTRKTGFEYLRRKADRATGKKVRDLRLPGIGILPESKRFYPGKKLASHAIGFVGLDNEGLSGLELMYDGLLRGKPGSVHMEQDLYGRPIPGTPLKSISPTHGSDLKLTLDKEIQYKAQVELKRAIKEWDAAGGWIIVMNSQTGEIYALATDPTYNLNKFPQASAELRKNRLVASVYEPGSTMKIVTAAAALEEGLYEPQSAFTLPGTIRVGGYTIGEAHPRGEEFFTFSDIIIRSSNIGAVTLGRALGERRLYDYAKRFGLNTPTGIELPGEVQGYIPTPDNWYASTLATVSFGQGISATALEIIRAVNVVAAGGTLVNPKIVRDADDSNQTARAINSKTEELERVLSTETAQTMATILHKTVEIGTGKQAQIPGYSVAGKTGTAQKPKQGEVGYESGKYISSFVGFTPAKDAELTILVAIDEPQGMYYGGVVAAPVFKAVGEYALQRLKIMP